MASRDDRSAWCGRGYGAGEAEGGAVGGVGGYLSTNQRETSASRASPLSAHQRSRKELAAENRRLYLDNMRLWDCLAVFRTDPSLTCQGAINMIFALDDNEYLREFPDTQQLLSIRYPGGVIQHSSEYDAVSENSRLKEENARLHAAVWVLRDNPTLQADSTVAAIFRLTDAQFQRKFHVVGQVSAGSGICRNSRNNNKTKVKALRTHLDVGPNTSTIHLVKKPLGPKRLSRAKSMSTNRQNDPIRATSGIALSTTRRRSESAQPLQDFSSNRKPTTLEDMQNFHPGHQRCRSTSSSCLEMLTSPVADEITQDGKPHSGGSDETSATPAVGNSRSDPDQPSSTNLRKSGARHSNGKPAVKPIKCVSFEEPLPSSHKDISSDSSEEDISVSGGSEEKGKTQHEMVSFKDRLRAILDLPIGNQTAANDNGACRKEDDGDRSICRGEEREQENGGTVLAPRERTTSLTCVVPESGDLDKASEVHIKATGEMCAQQGSVGGPEGRDAARTRSWKDDDVAGSSSNSRSRRMSRCPADEDDTDDEDADGEAVGVDIPHYDFQERSSGLRHAGGLRMSSFPREPSKRHKRDIHLSPVLDPRTSLHRLHVSAGDSRLLVTRPSSTEENTPIEPLDRNYNQSVDDSLSSLGRCDSNGADVERSSVSTGQADDVSMSNRNLKKKETFQYSHEFDGQTSNVQGEGNKNGNAVRKIHRVRFASPVDQNEKTKETIKKKEKVSNEKKENVSKKKKENTSTMKYGVSKTQVNGSSESGANNSNKAQSNSHANVKQASIKQKGDSSSPSRKKNQGKTDSDRARTAVAKTVKVSPNRVKAPRDDNLVNKSTTSQKDKRRNKAGTSQAVSADKTTGATPKVSGKKSKNQTRLEASRGEAVSGQKGKKLDVEQENQCGGRGKGDSCLKEVSFTDANNNDTNDNKGTFPTLLNIKYDTIQEGSEGHSQRDDTRRNSFAFTLKQEAISVPSMASQRTTRPSQNATPSNVFIDQKQRHFRRSSDGTNGAGLDLKGMSTKPEIASVQQPKRRTHRPRSAGTREFTTVRQANLKKSAERLVQESKISPPHGYNPHVGRDSRFTTKSLSRQMSAPKFCEFEGEPIHRNSKRLSRAMGDESKTSVGVSISQVAPPMMVVSQLHRSSSGFRRHGTLSQDPYSSRFSTSRTLSYNQGHEPGSPKPEVYLSNEPAPPRPDCHRPYPHRTYVTVKHFTDRHQRIMPQSQAPHMTRRGVSAIFSFSREKSPSMAFVLDEDFQRWMDGRVRASVMQIPQDASYSTLVGPTGPGQRWNHSPAVKQNLERWPKCRTPKDSIYSHIKEPLAGRERIAQEGLLKECSTSSPCVKKKTRARLLKELGGAKYTQALATMIQRNTAAPAWKPLEEQNTLRPNLGLASNPRVLLQKPELGVHGAASPVTLL